MKLTSFMGVVATALFVTTGYASAYTIDIFQTNEFAAGGNPAAPAGFTLLDAGTGIIANALQTSSGFGIGSVTFGFAGGSPVSGEYAGNTTGTFASPFGFGDSLRNYIVAGGSGGTVSATWTTTQNELRILWGTVDDDPGQNLITIGSTQIDGAAIHQAIIDQGLTWFGDGTTNAFLRITGLPDFTSVTLSDSGAPAFEFALGVAAPQAVPGPIVGAGLPGLVLAAGALLALARRRRDRQDHS